MLWDIVRDFFVQNIFGGVDSDLVVHSSSLGSFVDSTNDYRLVDNATSDVYVLWSNFPFYNSTDATTLNGISIGDYLSTTFTIVTFILLFIVAVLAVRWCFRVFTRAWKWF